MAHIRERKSRPIDSSPLAPLLSAAAAAAAAAPSTKLAASSSLL
jgi:hypothetical protein